jgi:hypothetical protein
MGPAADYVMPDILRAFATASPTLRPFLVRTMRGIGTRANLVIPLLVSALEGSTGPEKVEILATLANYGRSAAAARSRVERILKNNLEDTETLVAAARALASIAPDVDTQALLLDLLESTLGTPREGRFEWAPAHVRGPSLPDELAEALSSIRDAAPFVSTRVHHILDQHLPAKRSRFDFHFPYSVYAFVALVEAHAPTTQVAVELLRRLYWVGSGRLIDPGARANPLNALARTGAAAAADALVEVATDRDQYAEGDPYVLDVLCKPMVDRDFAVATIRKVLREASDWYAEMASQSLEKLRPLDITLLEELAQHRNEKVRSAARSSLKTLQDLAARQWPLLPLWMRAIQPTEVPVKIWRDLSVIVNTRDARFRVESVIRRRLQKGTSALRATPSAEFESQADAPLTIAPNIPGFEVNPSQITFTICEYVHEFVFRIRTSPGMEPDVVATGKVLLFCEPLIVAEIPVTIFVNSELDGDYQGRFFESEVRTFDTVFVSYAREDVAVVKRVERVSRVLGTRFLRDTRDVRSGMDWQEEINNMISAADIFQLFWSRFSKNSKNVESEWKSALALGRSTFIRPCYWEVPMPEPPKELAHIHFAFLRLGEQLPAGGMSIPPWSNWVTKLWQSVSRLLIRKASKRRRHRRRARSDSKNMQG